MYFLSAHFFTFGTYKFLVEVAPLIEVLRTVVCFKKNYVCFKLIFKRRDF